MTAYPASICFVDDDPEVRATVERTLSARGLTVYCHASAKECLANADLVDCCLVITDLKMPDMDGLELLTHVRQRAPGLPVVVVTGYGDVPTAVRAMKNGAMDYLQKPIDRDELLRIVDAAVLASANRAIPSIRRPSEPLTRTEIRVLQLVLDGNSNRGIATLLCRSQRTIEVHRARIMRKFGAHNVADLVKVAGQAPLLRPR